MKLTREFDVAAPRERVATALCSESFQLEVERARVEVVSTAYHVTERSESSLCFEIRSVEYKRTKLGGIDRSGTLDAVTRCRWSAKDHALSWEYAGGAGERVKLSGVYRLHAGEVEGPTNVTYEMNIDVRIPLIGGQIAKLIAREFENTWPRYQAILRRHTAGRD